MFRTIKLKSILTIALIIISIITIGVGVVTSVKKIDSPRPMYTIVIDAGHGGRDDGCSGANGTKESNINLAIAKKLEDYLNTLGINVVKTREDGNGLYKADADNYKLSDMSARLEIIEKTAPDMVISIHANSYSDSSQRGAQAFFQEGDDRSLAFAESVQTQLVQQLTEARQFANDGDYYILKESSSPAILIECGYLSNPDDESLLTQEDYQSRVAYAIMCGVVKYFELCGND